MNLVLSQNRVGLWGFILSLVRITLPRKTLSVLEEISTRDTVKVRGNCESKKNCLHL